MEQLRIFMDTSCEDKYIYVDIVGKIFAVLNAKELKKAGLDTLGCKEINTDESRYILLAKIADRDIYEYLDTVDWSIKKTSKDGLTALGIKSSFEDLVKVVLNGGREIEIDEKYTKEVLSKEDDMGFIYEIRDNKVVLTRYIGSAVNIEVPSFVDYVASNALIYNCYIQGIKFKEGVQRIGSFNFMCDELTNIELPSSLETIALGPMTAELYEADSNKLDRQKVHFLNENTKILDME